MREFSIPSLIEQTSALNAQLASGELEPSGGAVAALVAAWAASLAAAAAERSRREWGEAAGAIAQGHALRKRALKLAQRDAHAHAEAMERLAARGATGAGADERTEVSDWRLGLAVEQAAEPPLELAGCGLNIAQLAQTIAAHAAGEVRADAAVAAHLAAAAARAGAHLVEINLLVGGDREPAARARELADGAAAAAAAAGVLD